MNLSAVDLNLLVVLDALLSEGSVTGAARRVGLSQPAVSNALARLRELVGDPLFVRSGRGLVPTTRARAIATPLHRCLATLRTTLAQPGPFDPRNEVRTFVVAMPDIAELVLLPALTARLRREAPGVALRIIASAAKPGLDRGDGGPDVAIGMFAGQSEATQPLFSLELVCLVRRDHPHVGTRLTLERFLTLDHILVAPQGTAGGIVDELLARRGLGRRVTMTLAHFMTAAMVVSQSDLVMSATSVVAAIAATMLPVRAVRHPLVAPTVTIAQRWHPRNEDDPAHRWLRSLIAEVATDAVRALDPSATLPGRPPRTTRPPRRRSGGLAAR